MLTVHIDRDFDAQQEMMEDAPGEDTVPETYIPNFRLANVSMSTPHQSVQTGAHLNDPGGAALAGSAHQNFDSFEPMLETDPFGLTASMHFPTPYTYDPQQGRR